MSTPVALQPTRCPSSEGETGACCGTRGYGVNDGLQCAATQSISRGYDLRVPLEFHHRLPRAVPIVDREEFLVGAARGRQVLHLGCVDRGLLAEKLAADALLHSRLHRVAARLVGIDQDAEGIERLRQLEIGADNRVGDVERLDTASLGQIDLVIAAEIIEHLDNPGQFLRSLRPLLERTSASLVLTTPNAFGFPYWWHAIRRRELVHPDHTCYFSYTTLSTLLRKCGYVVSDFRVYSLPAISLAGWLKARVWTKADLKVCATGEADLKVCAANEAGLKTHGVRRWTGAVRWGCYLLVKDVLLGISPALAHGLIVTARPFKNGERRT